LIEGDYSKHFGIVKPAGTGIAASTGATVNEQDWNTIGITGFVQVQPMCLRHFQLMSFVGLYFREQN